MAKRKLSFGEGGFKGFLARHVEKIVFGIVGLVSFLIIWSGFSARQGIEATKTPDALGQEVTRATSHLDSFDWETHFREKRSPEDKSDLTARAAETLQKLSEEAYAIRQMLAPPVSTPRTKRTDPDLLVPIDLQARPGYGALVKSTQIRAGARNAEDESVLDSSPEEELPELDPKKEYRKLPQNYGRTTAGGRRGEMGGGYGVGRSAEAGKGVYFVTVTGLVPFRQQLEIYQSSFLNASSFSAARDVPTYVSWVLERSPVMEGSDKREWTRITLKTAQNTEEAFGVARGGGSRDSGAAGGTDQLIDPRAQDRTLTRPGPPLIARDLDRLYRHHRILPYDEAIRQQRRLETEAVVEEQAGEATGPGDADDLGIEVDQRMMTGPNAERGGFSGEFGSGFPRGEPGGGSYTEEGSFGPERQMRGNAGDVAGNVDPSEAPEFKMFRYVDLKVDAGKSYVYRMRLVLEDPNFPMTAAAEPPESALEGAVIQRRKKLKADLATSKKRRYYRLTDRSEESNVVTVKEGQRLLAGEVTPARLTLPPKEGGFKFRPIGQEPMGQAMALRFDVGRAADIPGSTIVRRGTVPNFKVKETEALIPAYGMLEKMEDVSFELNSLVLDLRGGDKHAKYDELKAPGEFLMMDARGRLVVLNELKDAEEFEANTFPEEKPLGPRRGGDARPPEGGGDDGGRPNFDRGRPR